MSQKNLTVEELLDQMGMVNITGLTARYPDGHTYVITSSDSRMSPGSCGRNKDKVVVVTKSGRVWLGAATGHLSLALFLHMMASLEEKGEVSCGNTFVPCSNGDTIHPNDLLRRFSDPDCLPR